MKKAFALSLALNVALIAAGITGWRAFRSAVPPAFANVPRSSAGAPAAAASVARASAALPQVRLGAGWRDWIEPLRAAGVPAEVLAGLVRADFERRAQAAQAALQARYLRGEIDSDRLAAAAVEQEIALERELQAALGPDDYRAWDLARTLEAMPLGRASLSEAERNEAYEIARGLRETLRQAELDRLGGTVDQATFTARQQAAQSAADEKLRALLGPARSSALQGADDTAARLRRALGDSALDAGQLDSLATAERRWDRTRDALATALVNTQDPAYAAALVQNDRQRQRDFTAIAGPGGLDAYLRATDSRDRELSQHAAVWGLSNTQRDDISRVLANYDAAVHEYALDARGRDVDAETTRDALAHFEADTRTALREKLGPAIYERLQQNGIVP
jgi:hypothetical protein